MLAKHKESYVELLKPILLSLRYQENKCENKCDSDESITFTDCVTVR